MEEIKDVYGKDEVNASSFGISEEDYSKLKILKVYMRIFEQNFKHLKKI